jgi:hypothetical protein
MKITIEKNLVSLIPENNAETAGVERLWRMLIDCVNETRKLAPVGEYVPQKKNAAAFYIEGLNVKTGQVEPGYILDHDGRVYCSICNKFIDLKAGARSPLCCGRPMELID